MKSRIQTVTPDSKASLSFYKKLGFELLEYENSHILSDGKCLIELNEDRFARIGLKLFKDSWAKEIKLLVPLCKSFKTENGFIINDTSGIWIYLEERTMDNLEIEGIPSSILGENAGISIETISIDSSKLVFEILGFEMKMGDVEQGWIGLQSKDGLNISLMKPLSCPHLFFNPSLTFFNGKVNNPKIIQRVRELEIPITEEITAFNDEGIVDNIIIRDPGGLGFFIFND